MLEKMLSTTDCEIVLIDQDLLTCLEVLNQLSKPQKIEALKFICKLLKTSKEETGDD